jgi:uncharacterized protein (TIGR03067 family)
MIRSLLFLGVVVCSSALVAADEKAEKALESLQGEWNVEKMVHLGNAVPADRLAKLTFTFKGSQLVPSDMPKDVATVILDPARKPAGFDITDRSKETMLGIFELKEDTLRICLAEPGAERPTEFASAKGEKTMYLVLKRAKK